MAGNAVSVFDSSAILDYSIKKTAPKRASVSGGFTLISFRGPLFEFGQPLARLVGKITNLIGDVNRCS
jgi:hypothetical protein